MAIEFDCYLVDEITAVGDARFATRCEKLFEETRQNPISSWPPTPLEQPELIAPAE